MDSYFDFDHTAIPTFDLDFDGTSLLGETDELDGNECFDSLFLDKPTIIPIDQSAQPEVVKLQLTNNREVEAIRWNDDSSYDYPMFRAKTPCALCARMGMDCYLAKRGMLITGCTVCINLYRECSFTHAEMPKGYISTFAGITEDEQVCHGATTERSRALNSSGADGRGRKSGARFHRDAVKILKSWLSEHADHPYPNERERDELKHLTGLKRSQINNWLANARRRGKVRSVSRPVTPTAGAVDIPTQSLLERGYENLDPMDRWKCSPPEHEPASMTAIARAVTSNEFVHPASRNHSATSLHSSQPNSRQNSRPSSRKASSDEDALSIMFNAPSVSSFETRESSNSTSLSLASSRSHRSKQSWASSQDRRRRRRNPFLHQRKDSSGTNPTGPPSTKPRRAGATGNSPNSGNGGKERIFQCTFCTERFPSKYDWQRHEKSLHLALERWTCCPMGPNRIDPTTGLHQCVFCPELEPTADHLETHNFSACHEKTVPERTFYRKDHLRQHLRLMHGGIRFDSHMDTWKSTTFEIKSRCGFCPSLFTTWQQRADHLAAHFRNGADMKDWGGSWGFEPFVERLVENAVPPYLIGLERNTMNPYRAREASNSISNSSSKTSPTNNGTAGKISDKTPSALATIPDSTPTPTDEKVEADQMTKDTNCWARLEESLIKYVNDQKSQNAIPSDKQIQDYARLIIYGDADPWDWTMADHPVWLDAFKLEQGILQTDPVGSDLIGGHRETGMAGDRGADYSSTRNVPVLAPYVVRGGLRGKRATGAGVGAGHGTGSVAKAGLPGILERNCAGQCNLSQTSSGYPGGTPTTPDDQLAFDFPMTGTLGPIVDGTQAMDLGFDAIDFNNLDLNTFEEMEFGADEIAGSAFGQSLSEQCLPLTTTTSMMADMGTTYVPATTQGMGSTDFRSRGAIAGIGQPTKPLVTQQRVRSFEDEPEMSLEDFDHLTGYMAGFR